MDDVLVKKLQFKRDYNAAILNAPSDYLDRLGIPVIGDLSIRSSLDFIQVFVTGKLEFLLQLPVILRALKPDGLLWICYSGDSTKMPTDVNRYILWAEMAKLGMVAVAMIPIDEIWSAMRFQPSGKLRK